MNPVVPQTLHPAGTSEFLSYMVKTWTGLAPLPWEVQLLLELQKQQRLKTYTETHTSDCVKWDETVIFHVLKYLVLLLSSQLL